VKKGRQPLLSAQHLAYLVSPMVLQKWACKTLAERVVLFHRRFGEAKISTQTLLQAYKKSGIKRKALRFVKTMRYQEPEQRKLLIEAMIDSVKQATSQGKRIIFSDEAVFTTATLLDKAYAPKKHNVNIEEKLASSPAVAVVAGVSAEIGLEGYFIQARSIDSDAFIQFVLTVLERSKPETFVLFLDNCRVHHSKKITQFLLENRIEVIFNVAYAPQYNPIERVWAQIKYLFKKEKMTHILEGRYPNYEKMIRQIMDAYPAEKISSICKGTVRSQMGF
jgi:transposase